jgi:hypothetical protein
MPDSDAREYAAKLVKQREKHVLISTTVLEGDGFWMSAARLVTQAIFAFSQGRKKNKVFATIDEAAIELAPYVKPNATVPDVLAALRSIRAAPDNSATGS